MTELEELEHKLEKCASKTYTEEYLVEVARRLLAICKEQNRMLCRFSQDSEAMQMGREEVVRALEARIEAKTRPPAQDLDQWLQAGMVGPQHIRTAGVVMDRYSIRKILGPAIDPGTVRPDYEELLDRLWEAKKIATRLDYHGSAQPRSECGMLIRELLELLSK